MSSLIIKIIALITMTIDHSGYILFNNNMVFRLIGRMAFPLYGFLLVEGFNHVKNDKNRFIRYLLSIFILACLSEPIYDKLFYNSYMYIFNQNILFTLSISLICMYIYEKNSSTICRKIISILIVIYISFLSLILYVDYSFLGILLIFGYYLVSKSTKYKNVFLVIITLLYSISHVFIYGFNYNIFGVLLSLIPILLYNGKKGYSSKILQYFFYLYYPIHLLILLLIKN